MQILIVFGNEVRNEQTNGMIRRFIPKGSVICKIPVRKIVKMQNRLNNYPRRKLDGMSTLEKGESIRQKCLAI